MFTNPQSSQRLKLISEPSIISNFPPKNSQKGYSKENVCSEIDSMNETPSKTPTQPLSNRRQSNFGLEKHHPFDQKGFGSPDYDDISNNNTPIHNPSGVPTMAERIANHQEKIVIGQDFLENRRFSMRNTASVSWTNPELAAAIVASQNLGIIDASLATKDPNILASRNSCQDNEEESPMFKEIGESFILHSKTDGEDLPVQPSSSKNKVRRSRHERSKQVTADTEPSGQRVETKTSGEPSIYSPSVNEIDPCQNTTRQTTEKSEENIFNKTLVTSDLPVQISTDNQVSLQTLLNQLQISKDQFQGSEEPQSHFQTQSSLELHNVYEEEIVEEKAANISSSQQYRSKSSQAKYIVPSAMNKSELESLYDKLESPTSEDIVMVENQIRGSRNISIENILSLEKNTKKQQSHKKNKKSGEFNLPLQQSSSGKKSNNASLSVDRGNNRGFTENFTRLLKNKTRGDDQDLDDMMYTEIDDFDNIENQRLSLHIKMATRDNLATPPQYSARFPSARPGSTLDSCRLRTQQCEKSMMKNSGAMTRLERDYLADMDRKKRLAELVAQSTKNQTRKTPTAAAAQNRSMIKKVVPEKKEERIVMKSKMPTRRESHVDMAEIKREVSAEKSAIIIDRPLQMKPKKEDINLEVINTLRLKRQNPDNVLFKKSQSKSIPKKRFGNNTDRINFNETILLNKSQDLSRSFVDKNKTLGNKIQEAAAQKMSIGEAKGWSNTLDAVMSGINGGGVSKTWESLTRKITSTVNYEVVNIQEEKELLAEYASQAKIAAESTDILTKRSNNSDIEEMITSQFNIKDIKLDSLAFLLLRQSEEKAARTIQRFMIKKYNFKSRNNNMNVEPKAIANLDKLFKHYEEVYSKISGSIGVEGTKFTQKELIMTFITISCFLNSKNKLNNANKM